MLFNKNLFAIPQLFCAAALFCSCSNADSKAAGNKNSSDSTQTELAEVEKVNPFEPVDSAKYHKLQKYLANGDTTGKWPVKKDVLPGNGAILPFKRIIAFYGNLYSKKWVL